MYCVTTLAVHYAIVFAPSLYTGSGRFPVGKAASKSRFEIEGSIDYLPTSMAELNSVLGRRDGPGPCSRMAHQLPLISRPACRTT
jgi:hypothetical protein